VIEFSLDYLVAILENIPLVQYFLTKYFMNQLALVDFVIAIVSKKIMLYRVFRIDLPHFEDLGGQLKTAFRL
jgi:hypothetical protein